MKTDPPPSCHPAWGLLGGFFFWGLSRLYYPLSNTINSWSGNLLGCGFKKWTGMECPTCGGSRSAYFFSKGDWGTSLYFHPAVFLLCLFVFLGMTESLLCFISGRSVPVRYTLYGYIFLTLVLISLVFWTWKLVRGG